jgi:hypothetical protein
VDDEQTILEFRQQAFREKWQIIVQRIKLKRICDKWALLVRCALYVSRLKERTRIALNKLAVAAELTRTLQVSMPTRAFVHVANNLEIWHECSKFLCQGVLNKSGNCMQIWASRSEMRSEKIKALVLHAKYVSTLFARADIALRLPISSGQVWSTMRLDREMPIESVKAVAAVSLGRPSRTLRLTHLNSELICGTLGSNDVLPGSCLIVEFRE